MWNGQPFPVSAQQLVDLINIDSTRTPAYATQFRSPRYRLLDPTLAPISTGVVGPLGDAGDITQFVTGCRISCDTTRPVHRDIAITLLEAAGYQFDPLIHLVQAFVDLWDGPPTGPLAGWAGPTLLGEVPIGVFGFVMPDRDIADAGNVWTCSGLDLTSWINQLVFLNDYAFPPGTNVVTAIRTLLMMDFLPKSLGGGGQTPVGLDDVGPGFPASRISITPTTAVTPTALLFSRGTNKLTAINQLLDSIVYYPLWCDEVGTLRSGPKPDYSVSAPAAGWVYRSADPSSIVINGSVQERWTNQADLRNIEVFYAEPTNGTPLYSIASNNATTKSRIALSNLKRAMPRVTRDDKAPNQAYLDAKSHVALQYDAALDEQVTFKTFPNPLHQSHDILDVTITDATGETVLVGSDLGFEEIAWEFDMDAWEMVHHAARMVPV